MEVEPVVEEHTGVGAVAKLQIVADEVLMHELDVRTDETAFVEPVHCIDRVHAEVVRGLADARACDAHDAGGEPYRNSTENSGTARAVDRPDAVDTAGKRGHHHDEGDRDVACGEQRACD